MQLFPKASQLNQNMVLIYPRLLHHVKSFLFHDQVNFFSSEEKYEF